MTDKQNLNDTFYDDIKKQDIFWPKHECFLTKSIMGPWTVCQKANLRKKG